MRLTIHRLVPALLLLALSCAPALCQPGPEAFMIPAQLGMSSPTTTRQLAMGVPITCLDDIQFANPAFAAVHRAPDAGLRYVVTNFDSGPLVNSFMLNCFVPLTVRQEGFHLTYLDLQSSRGQDLTFGPFTADMSESALVVDYGRRLSPTLTAGLSILGGDSVGFTINAPAGPPMLDLSAQASFGGRVGLAWEYLPGDFVGVLYSFTRYNLDAAGTVFPGPFEMDFDASQFGLGVSHHVTPELLAVAEFQRGTSKSDVGTTNNDTWRFGAEYAFAPGWAGRLGFCDGQLTYGGGYSGGAWRVDYAFLQDWYGDDMSPLFGGSTTHSLQASFSW